MITEISLEIAERVMRAIADAGLAPRRSIEVHSVLESELRIDARKKAILFEELAMRFEIKLFWDEARDWQTVADVVRSVQGAPVL